MKIQNLLFLFIAVFAFSFTSNAQTKQAVTKTQVNQISRINQGVRSGELTRVEAKKLKHQQRDINRTKHAAKADGKITAKEKAVIRHKQHHANVNIAVKKNNKRSR